MISHVILYTNVTETENFKNLSRYSATQILEYKVSKIKNLI